MKIPLIIASLLLTGIVLGQTPEVTMAPDSADHQAVLKDLLAKVDAATTEEQHWHYMEITGPNPDDFITYCPLPDSPLGK